MGTIRLYTPNDESFNHNRYVITECLSCKITEKLNNVFNLELEYPIYDFKQYSNLFKRGWVISAPVPDNRPNQLFRIISANRKTDTGIIEVRARCIAQADLSINFIADTNIVGKNRVQAIQQLLQNTLDKNPYKVVGDNDETQNNMRVVRYSPLQAILGNDDNTMINRYGGDYIFDNFTIHAYKQKPCNKVYKITHGVNLEAIEETFDDSNLVTRIIPQGDNELLLPEYHIDSPKINDYERVYNKHITFSGIGEKDGSQEGEEVVTKEQALQKLRDTAKKVFSEQHIDELQFNYKVDFLLLSQTEEYANYIELQNVVIGDIVTIRHKPLNLILTGRVISYEYDCLQDKYLKLEIGVEKRTISDAITDTEHQVKIMDQIIELGVAKLDQSLSAKITITANKINETIKDVNNNLTTEINKVAGQIESKVGKDDVISIVQQNPDSVIVAFNNGSQYIKITNQNGLEVIHNNGSRTYMNGNGIKWHNGSNSKDYHYLTHVIGFTTTSDPSSLSTVQLPDEFRGKDFRAYATLSDTWEGSWNHTEPWVLQRMVAFVDSTDKNNATVKIKGYRTDKNYKTGAHRYASIAGMLIVIA